MKNDYFIVTVDILNSIQNKCKDMNFLCSKIQYKHLNGINHLFNGKEMYMFDDGFHAPNHCFETRKEAENFIAKAIEETK